MVHPPTAAAPSEGIRGTDTKPDEVLPFLFPFFPIMPDAIPEPVAQPPGKGLCTK